jgi:hypothetical protein
MEGWLGISSVELSGETKSIRTVARNGHSESVLHNGREWKICGKIIGRGNPKFSWKILPQYRHDVTA